MITYSPAGELVCCGEPMGQGVSTRGDLIATCAKCNNSYEAGSFRHNPAPEIRQERPMPLANWRYLYGHNYIVKDGVVQDGH